MTPKLYFYAGCGVLAVAMSFMGGCTEDPKGPIEKPLETDKALERHFLVSGSGFLKGTSTSENGSSNRSYLVIHDKDSNVDYLIVQDAGIIKLEAKVAK